MKKSKKEFNDLSLQFEHPLENVTPTLINNDSQAEQFLSDIEIQIKNRDDWTVRLSGIQLALSCLKGGITNYLSIDYSSIASDLSLCLTDLRSTLVKTSSLLVAASSQTLQERYITSIKIIIPALFKQLSHGTAIISESSKFALIELAKNIPNSKTFQTIIPKIQSKSSQQRLAIADVLFAILEKWPNSKITLVAESINKSLEVLIEDPSQNVRKAARKSMLLFKSKCAKESSIFPNSSKEFSSSAKIQKKNYNLGDKKQSVFTLSMRNSLTKVTKTQKTPKTPKLVETKSNVTLKHKKIRSFSPIKKNPRQISSPSKKMDKEKEPKKPKSQLQIKNTTQSKIKKQDKTTPIKPKKLYFVTPYPRNNQRVQFVDTSDNDDMPTPKDVKQFSFTLPAFQPKGILKPSNYPNIIRKSEIEYYMPPKTMNDAESFHEALIDIVDTEMFEKIDGIEGLLAPSIIAAAQFVPSIDEWDSVIPILLSQYPDDFKSNIHDLIVSFRCDPWLISYACDVFGSQYVAEKFAFSKLNASEKKNNKYKLKFFCSLFEQNIPIQITPELEVFLKNLAENNQNFDGIEFIENVLENESDEDQDQDLKQNVINIIQKIKGGYDCHDEANSLNSIVSKSPKTSAFVESILESELPQIIAEGRDPQRYAAFLFIQNIPSISTVFLVDSMIFLIAISNSEEDHDLNEKTKDCLMSMMNDVHVFSYLLESLDSSNQSNEEEDEEDDQVRQQIILSVLLNYFQNCSDETMVELLPEAFNQLSPILESDVTSLRRIVVFIFVEFKCKIPEAFEFYADKIPTKHQKLIELYTSRRKVRST